MQEQAREFLQWYEGQCAELEKRANGLAWQAALSGREEDYRASAEAGLALRRFHSDPARWNEVRRLLQDRDHLDPIHARSLELVELAYRANQLPEETLRGLVDAATEIEQRLSTYRARLDGREYSNNELLARLREEKESGNRQTIWEALKQVGREVGPKLVRLAQLRNQAARQLQYENFWQMQMHLQEHEPAEVEALFHELERTTREPFTQMKAKLDAELAKRFGCGVEELGPWHYDNPFFQAAPPLPKLDPDEFYRGKSREEIIEIARRFYREVGLPVEEVLRRSDLYERAGKDQHAFCTHIDREGDVRVLCNVRPTAEWMGVTLHELGHAVYDMGVDRHLPFTLRQPAHALTTEGVAMLFEAKALEPGFLVQYVGVDPSRASAASEALAEQQRRNSMIFARWTLVMFHFEKALYEHPQQDLNRLWWDLVERFQQLHRPAGRNEPDWAAKPHFTIAPVYYHNYMLGELFASQLRHAVGNLSQASGACERSGAWTPDEPRGAKGPASSAGSCQGAEKGASPRPAERDARLGRFLQERVFAPGALWRWPELVRRATGEPLTARYFAEELTQE